MNQSEAMKRVWEGKSVVGRDNWIKKLADGREGSCTRRYRNLGYIIWDGVSPLVEGMAVRARSVGWRGKGLVFWVSCPQCGKARWVRLNKRNNLCKPCGWAKGAKHRVGVMPVSIRNRYESLGYKMYDGNGNPAVGMFISATKLGMIGQGIMFWEACPQCSYERWVAKVYRGCLCKRCGIDKRVMNDKKKIGCLSRLWKGGRRLDYEGYVILTIGADNPFVSMAKRGSGSYVIKEHRLVMAQYLSRLLEPWEVVHHRNGDKGDNHIENLELFPRSSDHSVCAIMQREINKLERRVTILEAENVVLERWLATRVL